MPGADADLVGIIATSNDSNKSVILTEIANNMPFSGGQFQREVIGAVINNAADARTMMNTLNLGKVGFSRDLSAVRSRISELTVAVAQAQAQIDQQSQMHNDTTQRLTQRINSIQAQIAALEGARKDLSPESVAKRTEAAKHEVASLRQEVASLQAQHRQEIKALRDNIGKQQQKIEQAERELADLQANAQSRFDRVEGVSDVEDGMASVGTKGWGAREVVLFDSRIDPSFARFLSDMSSEAAAIERDRGSKMTDSEKVAFAMKFLEQRMPSRDADLSKQLVKDKKGEIVLIGSLLDEGQGVCRHRAPLMAFMLKRLGVSGAKIMRGDVYRDAQKAHGDDVESQGRHVWVEVNIGGRDLIVDPMWGRVNDKAAESSRAVQRVADDGVMPQYRMNDKVEKVEARLQELRGNKADMVRQLEVKTAEAPGLDLRARIDTLNAEISAPVTEAGIGQEIARLTRDLGKVEADLARHTESVPYADQVNLRDQLASELEGLKASEAGMSEVATTYQGLGWSERTMDSVMGRIEQVDNDSTMSMGMKQAIKHEMSKTFIQNKGVLREKDARFHTDRALLGAALRASNGDMDAISAVLSSLGVNTDSYDLGTLHYGERVKLSEDMAGHISGAGFFKGQTKLNMNRGRFENSLDNVDLDSLFKNSVITHSDRAGEVIGEDISSSVTDQAARGFASKIMDHYRLDKLAGMDGKSAQKLFDDMAAPLSDNYSDMRGFLNSQPSSLIREGVLPDSMLDAIQSLARAMEAFTGASYAVLAGYGIAPLSAKAVERAIRARASQEAGVSVDADGNLKVSMDESGALSPEEAGNSVRQMLSDNFGINLRSGDPANIKDIAEKIAARTSEASEGRMDKDALDRMAKGMDALGVQRFTRSSRKQAIAVMQARSRMLSNAAELTDRLIEEGALGYEAGSILKDRLALEHKELVRNAGILSRMNDLSLKETNILKGSVNDRVKDTVRSGEASREKTEADRTVDELTAQSGSTQAESMEKLARHSAATRILRRLVSNATAAAGSYQAAQAEKAMKRRQAASEARERFVEDVFHPEAGIKTALRNARLTESASKRMATLL
ncbi:MAG: transglutaminase domain-containing protein, partial [Candidatus Omnitrophica bacterium]|nr:transglutaminase domain-containing protein [Candidatus Omnitrophota bacterium]